MFLCKLRLKNVTIFGKPPPVFLFNSGGCSDYKEVSVGNQCFVSHQEKSVWDKYPLPDVNIRTS